MVILQRIYHNLLNGILQSFGLQYMTVGELWVMVILQYMPVCYKICYFCICILTNLKNKVISSTQPYVLFTDLHLQLEEMQRVLSA